MQWTAAAEQAHDAAVLAMWDTTLARYGRMAARYAEAECSWCVERVAEDFARADGLAIGQPPMVAVGHVKRAAAAYRFRPLLRHRVTGIRMALATLVTRTAGA